jgi:hypothetical protein
VAYPNTVVRLASKQIAPPQLCFIERANEQSVATAGKCPRVTTSNRSVLCGVFGDLYEFLSNIRGPTPQRVQHPFLVKGHSGHDTGQLPAQQK